MLFAIIAQTGAARSADVNTLPLKTKPVQIDSPFFTVNDNRLTFAYQFNATQPGVASDTAKQVYAFTHFDVWAYGTNFLSMEMRKSDHYDPANPCRPVVGTLSDCAGNTEFYGIVRSTLGWNQLFNTNAFSVGPLRNVSFEAGVDLETMNSYLALNKKNVVAGLQFAFDLPYKGYFNIAPMYYQEWNHNANLMPANVPPGFTGLSDGTTRFNPTWTVEFNYYMDLGFLPQELQYFAVSGRLALVGPKGNGASNGQTIPSTNTVMEINSEPIRLTLDASKALWGPKYSHLVDVWVAYRYWENKFGLDDSNPKNRVCFFANGTNNGSCTEKTLYSGLSVKF